ncbi:MAG: response regulator transcription factor [Betaproteobacteria bacterium]|nr:response regulator transcription factor [Betaproteobacteria bacterium]
MRILVVDDHAVVREGLHRILARLPDPVETGEAANAAEALHLLGTRSWDAVLLDIALPGRSGIDVLKQLARVEGAPPVLVLSSFPEEQYAVRLLRAGAMGYLNKEAAPDQLLTAIRIVTSGRRYISNRLAAELAASLGADWNRPTHTTLSDREFMVLRLLASGRTISEIARQASLSVKTVSTYRSRLLEKLGLNNTVELITYAVKNNMVD